jgi:hypothetical protein
VTTSKFVKRSHIYKDRLVAAMLVPKACNISRENKKCCGFLTIMENSIKRVDQLTINGFKIELVLVCGPETNSYCKI